MKQKGLILVEIIIVAGFIFILVISGYYLISKMNSNNELVSQEINADLGITPELNELETQQKSTSTPETINKKIDEASDATPASVSTPVSILIPTSQPASVPEPEPQDEEETNLEITNIQIIPSAYETRVTWNTNLPADGKVTLWPTNTPSGNLVVGTSNTTNHSVDLITNPNKTYNYNIESTTSDGKRAVSDQKEITTPTDNVAPAITGISTIKNGAGITMTISANEPVVVNVYYRLKNSSDTTIKDTGGYVGNHLITQVVWYPLSGWNSNTQLEYQIIATDRSSNQFDYGTRTINVDSIPEE